MSEKIEVELSKSDSSEIARKINEIFRVGGLVNEIKSNYEYRQQQVTMALGINDSFNNAQHFICEAGTGSGKSFAYLVPSMLMAKEMPNRIPILIATGTIALQEQIVKKDVPFLKEVIKDVKVEVAKGRANYFCPDRFYGKFSKQLKTSGSSVFDRQLKKLRGWSRKTEIGDKSEIDFELEPSIWMRSCANSDECEPRECKEKCFFREAKKKLGEADVIIANHHLLFADLDVQIKSGICVLPEYQFLIVDEAHKMEDVATDYLSEEVSQGMIKFLLSDSYKKEGKYRGVVYSIYMGSSGVFQSKMEKEFVPAYDDLKSEAGVFFKKLQVYLKKESTRRVKNFNEFSFEVGYDNFLNSLMRFKKALDLVVDLANKNDNYEKRTINELNNIVKRTDKFVAILGDFKRFNLEYVHYIENIGGEENPKISIKVQPINVSNILERELFKKKRSIILTSATLSTNNTFDYIRNRIGLRQRFYQGILPPVFDYYNQVKIYIANDMPDPNNRNYAEFNKAAIERIGELVKKLGGKAFVLFTSYALMEKAYRELRFGLEKEGIKVLVQGGGKSPSSLIKQFKKDVKSVLFGTDTFWEGVDVPGEALSNIIITKLPFAVPNHPVIEARMEYIERNGGNSFFDYSIPKAVIKLKQGFGRLIRTKTDSGICCILDPRVVRKGYGRIFVSSLPACKYLYNI